MHGVPRAHHVTAIVLAHQGAEWLPRTLAALGAQDRGPDRRLGVDAGSTDGSAELLRAALPAVLDVDGAAGTARALALATALRELGADEAGSAGSQGSPDRTTEPEDGPIRWFWIVHDDSAPEPA